MEQAASFEAASALSLEEFRQKVAKRASPAQCSSLHPLASDSSSHTN